MYPLWQLALSCGSLGAVLTARKVSMEGVPSVAACTQLEVGLDRGEGHAVPLGRIGSCQSSLGLRDRWIVQGLPAPLLPYERGLC